MIMHSFYVIESHSKEVNCCAFSADYFVTCSGDKTIRVYFASNFKELKYSPIKIFKYGVNFVKFDNSGQYLASACNDGKAHLFHLSDEEVKVVTIFRHSDTNTAQVCSFSPDSKFLVTGSADGSIALWDIEKKKLKKEIAGHAEGNVYAATFTPCGSYLVTGSALGDIRVWDAATMQALTQTEAHDEGISSCGVTCITFSPVFHSSIEDPQRSFLMASAGQDNKIKIWVLNNQGRTLAPFRELIGHLGPVSFCCFSSDGNTLASSSFDKTVMIWDHTNGDQLMVLDGHESIVTSVAYSPNNYLASTCYDKKVIIWKMYGDDNEVSQEINSVITDQSQPPTENIIELENAEADDAAKSNFEAWSCDEVVSWLTDSVKLGQYSDTFRQNEIDGAELLGLTSEVLQKDLGIAPLGHRNKILRAIKSLQELKDKLPLNRTKVDGLDAATTGIQSLSWQKLPASNIKVTTRETDGDIPDQYLCPISREIMNNPVIAADGFTYERSMIEGWFLKGSILSPMSNKKLSSKNLIPNQTLKSLIVQYLEEQNKVPGNDSVND